MASIRELLEVSIERLAAVSETPRLDAELLLSRALDRPRSHLLAWPEREPDAGERQVFEDLLNRRSGGEPMAHILGEREFWSMTLRVTPDTLIPRPDTEILVETALERIPAAGPCRVLDMGTGTGAVALAIARERPFAEVTATDHNTAVLDVARMNARENGVELRFADGDWWQAVAGERFDVVVSNPPYIRDDDPHLERGDLRFEPRGALRSGPDGLDDIRRIVAGAREGIVPGGWLLLEHGHDQAAAVRELLATNGFIDIRCTRDLGGNDRVTAARIRPAEGDAA